jgi:hypothetical protein
VFDIAGPQLREPRSTQTRLPGKRYTDVAVRIDALHQGRGPPFHYSRPVARSSWQFPLQTGVVAQRWIVLSAFLIGTLAPLFVVGVVLVPLVAAVLAGSIALSFGWWARASDLLIDETGVMVKGGPQAGTARGFGELADPARQPKLEPAFDERSKWQLSIGGEVVAWSEVAAEIESFRTIVESLRSAAGLEVGVATNASVAATIEACPNCGAPLSVDDAPEVSCSHCGTSAPLREDVRARIRAARIVSREQANIARALERLRDEPSAGRINALLVLSWITLVASGLCLWGAFYFRVPWVALGFIVGPLCWAIAATNLATRKVVRVCFAFAAAPPQRPGGAATCRCCAAPLPPPVASSIVVKCAYCSAQNILGVDLRRPARIAQVEEVALGDALAFHRHHRIVRAVVLATSMLALAAAIAAAVVASR